MKLKSFGCSFIYGSDLDDCKHIDTNVCPSMKTWPALIASRLGMEYVCRARGGSGNLCILDRIMKSIRFNGLSFYCINWSYIDRFDYVDINGGIGEGNDWKSLTPKSLDQIGENYYRNLHSEYRDKLTSLMYIKTAIDFLKKNNCPFIMTYMDNLILDKHYHMNPGIEQIQNSVRDSLHDFEGLNFLDWSRHQGYKISPQNHPLEDAHQAAAEYLMPIIDAILRRASQPDRWIQSAHDPKDGLFRKII